MKKIKVQKGHDHQSMIKTKPCSQAVIPGLPVFLCLYWARRLVARPVQAEKHTLTQYHSQGTWFCYITKILFTICSLSYLFNPSRLKDERIVMKLIDDVSSYLEPRATTDELCRMYLRKILHIYYKVNWSKGSNVLLYCSRHLIAVACWNFK